MSIEIKQQLEITTQCNRELDFSKKYKKKKRESRWKQYETMLNGNELPKSYRGNSRLSFGMLHSYVRTIQSKIDTPISFKYLPTGVADKARADKANKIKDQDSRNGGWNFKDLFAKYHAIIYGRGIMKYYAESEDGYTSNLEVIHPRKYHIDPSVGGFDLGKAAFEGNEGMYLTKYQMEQLLENENYITENVKELVDSFTESKADDEEIIVLEENTKIDPRNTLEFAQWFTTFKGKKYYVVFSTKYDKAIRIQEMSKVFESEKTPYVSFSPFPDSEEFWSYGYCDDHAGSFLAQTDFLNQLINNAEQTNNPLRFVQPGIFRNPTDLLFKRSGFVMLKDRKEIGDVNIASMIQELPVPGIRVPGETYELLSSITQRESGVSAATRGLSDQDKVGINETNLAAEADRFNLVNKSYSEMYKHLGILHYYGLMEHLTDKIAVRMIGEDGLAIEETIKATDLHGGKILDVTIDSGATEAGNDIIRQRNKLNLLTQYANPTDPTIGLNQKVLFSKLAKLSDFEQDEVLELTEPEYASSESVSNAATDFDRIIKGEEVEVRSNVTASYMKILNNLLEQYSDEVTQDQLEAMTEFMKASAEQLIVNNTGKVADQLASQGQLDQLGSVVNQQPAVPVQNPLEEIAPQQ